MAIKQVQQASTALNAAGILFVCPFTQRVLTILRSRDVVDPSCWCGVGGKIDGAESPEEAAIREAQEEIQFFGGVKLEPLLVYRTESLVFHNFMGIVYDEFKPILNWESDGYAWTSLDKLPHPMHYGLTAVLADAKSSRLIRRALT